MKEDIAILTNHEKLTYPDIQKANAILDMKEDYDRTLNSYQNKKQEESLKKIRRR